MKLYINRALSLSLVSVWLGLNLILVSTQENQLNVTHTTNGSAQCPDEDAVAVALQTLSMAQTVSEQESIKKHLLDVATKSVNCRRLVIKALVKAMDTPDLDLARDRRKFYVWHYGTSLLGDLKAVEALDLLIKYLDLHDGTPFPLNHHPAVGAVIAMGPIALPKLKAVVNGHPDRYTRRYALFCVSSIGGPSARQILEEVAHLETDPCCSQFIRASLEAFNNVSQPNQIRGTDNGRWYSAFLCDGN